MGCIFLNLIDIKTTEVPLVLRPQNRWVHGIVGDLGFFGAEGAVIMEDRDGN
jgi:hypothetical protein